MKLKNLMIYQEGGIFTKGDIAIENEYIAFNSKDPFSEDMEGLYAIPGLIDIHFHGCIGHDFCEGTKESLDQITKYQAENGITAVLPASMTLPEETLTHIFQNAANYHQSKGALFLGINMEGPFFSEKKKGAQNPEYLKEPNVPMFERLQKAAQGKIRIACIAPELKNALPFIASASKKIKVSLAHTNADYDTAMQAFCCGASHVTHLCNAMPPFSHRAPGIIGAAADSGAVIELICDGVHIHPAMVRAIIKLFGKDKVILISDSMMATGLQDGNYTLGGQAVTVEKNRATLSDGTIAGSVTNLFACMKKAVSFGIPLETAIQMATKNPAMEIGVYHQMGSITIGKLANIVIINKNLEIQQVYIKGKSIL